MLSMSRRNALLVMDFQQDIVAMAAAGGSAKAVERAAAAVAAARSHGMLVVFVRVAYREGYPDAAPTNKRVSVLREKGLLRESSAGAQLVAGIGVQPDDPVVVKRRVSALAHTDLSTLLAANDVDTLVLSGLVTSGVVLSTVRQAADADYRLVVLEDACADGDPDVHRTLMSKVFPMQASVISVDAFVSELQAARR